MAPLALQRARIAISVLFAIFAAFTAAKVFAETFERIGQPPVVGELIAGIVVGPSLLGWVPIAGQSGSTMLLLSELGVIVLLFQVGLETRPEEMRRVGARAGAVSILGVVITFGLAIVVARSDGQPWTPAAFIATAAIATSAGISARVLSHLGRLRTEEGRTILGAAIIDDIIGLMVLAVVAGLARGSLSGPAIVVLIVEALGFVGVLVILGPGIIGRISPLLEAPRTARAPFAIALIALLGLSVAANRIRLTAVVGAFLAGLILSETSERFELERQIEPVADLLTPFFFVVTGAQIHLHSFTRASVVILAFLISAVAIAGKVLGGLVGARGLGRRASLIVGVGMVPRGEVGIVVASLALREGIVGRDVFGAVLMMVVITTLLAPPALQRLFSRERGTG